MTRHGFVPQGAAHHGNLCGASDTSGLTFLRAQPRVFRRPRLLLGKQPPYYRFRRGGLRPEFCSENRSLAPSVKGGFHHRFGRKTPILRPCSLRKYVILKDAT